MFPSLCLQSLSICDSCLSLLSTPEALVIEGEPKQDALILNVICKLQFSSSMNVLIDYIIQILGRTGPVIDWIPRKSCCWISAFLNSPDISLLWVIFSVHPCIYSILWFHPQNNMSDSLDEDVFCLLQHFTSLTPLGSICLRRMFGWT